MCYNRYIQRLIMGDSEMKSINSHVHLENGHPDWIIALAEAYDYEKIGVMAIPCHFGPLNTLECMLMKRLAPEKVYVYGGMVYMPGLEPTAKSHEKQLQLMMDAGCDGWKILESKPTYYKDLQLPLDGEVFSRAFAMAEREQIPIKWHAGDPATFWDEEKAPSWAAENGWLYTAEGYPTLEKIYSEVENVLAHHPKLRATLAHLYFVSDDIAHGERLLSCYENFGLDITPGTEMYEAFLADRDIWKAFFERWQDRLDFGTDMPDWTSPDRIPPRDDTLDLVYNALAGTEYFEEHGIAGVGLGLDKKIIDKIFYGNWVRRNGAAPRALNMSGFEAYTEWLLPKLNAEERKQAEALIVSYNL